MDTPLNTPIQHTPPRRISCLPEELTPLQHSTKEDRWAHLKAELKELGMMTGREALKHSGLAIGHETAIFNLARNLDTIVAIRPVNDKATSLIASLAAVKGLDDTHLKSASTGPMAGYIPIDPRLGKSGEALLKNRIAASKTKYKIDSNKPGVIASPLVIDENRRNELLAKGVMRQEGDSQVFCGGDNPSEFDTVLNKHFKFRLIDLKNGGFAVQYQERGLQGKPAPDWKEVEVVAKEVGAGQTPLPMTADYDILGYFPHISQFNTGKLSEKTVGKPLRELFQNLKASNASPTEIKHALIKSVTQKVREKLLGQTDRKHASPSRGSFTASEEFISAKLNKALRPEIYDENGQVKPNSAGVLIKHGPEVNNPHPENDEQVTIIGPKKMLFVTRNQGQLTKALSLIRANDFVVYTNRQWNSTKMENEQIKAGEPWNVNEVDTIQEPPKLKRLLSQEAPWTLDTTRKSLNFEGHVNKISKYDE